MMRDPIGADAVTRAASPGLLPRESLPQSWVQDFPTSFRMPVAGNGGTESAVTVQRFIQKFIRLFHWVALARTGEAETDISMPRVRRAPPLKIWLLKPAELSSERLINRSVMFFWNTVNSRFNLLPSMVASNPLSISSCLSGWRSVAPVLTAAPEANGKAEAGTPEMLKALSSVNFCPYRGSLPDVPRAPRNLSSSRKAILLGKRNDAAPLG